MYLSKITATRALQPAALALASKFQFLGIPIDILLLVVGEIHEMTAYGGAGTGVNVSDRLSSRYNRINKVLLVPAFFLLRQTNLRILEEFALGKG